MRSKKKHESNSTLLKFSLSSIHLPKTESDWNQNNFRQVGTPGISFVKSKGNGGMDR